MEQLDFFYNDDKSYLYGEIEKLKNSTDRRCRAIFSLLTELQDQVIKLQKEEKKENAM